MSWNPSASSARTSPPCRRTGGFTLIEIMVVVVIIGILVAFAVPNIMDNPEKARLTKARHDLRTIENALEMYKLDNFRYPTTAQGLKALVERPDTPPEPENWQDGGYLRELPMDPWGHPYKYLGPQDADGGRVEIITLGADGRPGGEGADADISSLNLQSDDG
ncbi:type II secretion system major pseudopilin GspG [Arhodomonas aquaeolei]|uniref:type II secretion system major pseudopilin GspG n=1 Tax=Arhodomonas aquaeolei TaxID=2369 RepID=UPI0003A3B2F1|nr:type II secretion system major pseudopilin GspG [Arhodomonas aquaeolei]